MKLYPGISPTAASRMERIAGSYASMSNTEQLSFTQQLRDARRKGAKAKAVTERSSNARATDSITGDTEEEAPREQIQAGSENSESREHKESENAGG